MPTRLIPQKDSISNLVVQPDTAQEISHQSSRWTLPKKGRNIHDELMQDRIVLKDGFVNFYQTEEPLTGLGDSCRRHFGQSGGSETTWKPCFKLVQAPDHQPKAFGKRAIEPPNTHNRVEEGDMPRGRKRCPPPVDQLPKEAKMFQLKGIVRDEEGERYMEKRCKVVLEDIKRAPKHVLPELRRNGVGQATCGDKPYSAVDYSNEFQAIQNPTFSRPGVERQQPKAKVQNEFLQKERSANHARAVSEVRSLPEYE